jgi:hypothetical protein
VALIFVNLTVLVTSNPPQVSNLKLEWRQAYRSASGRLTLHMVLLQAEICTPFSNLESTTPLSTTEQDKVIQDSKDEDL